ncbi:MAG: hypothetical protein ABL872_12940 [Lacibacter sp.]
MKSTAILLFSLLIGSVVHSQNCKILDKASFFRSIKFGDQLPQNLLSTCSNDGKQGSVYSLHFENLDKKCKKKYSNLFKLSSLVFSHLILTTNEKGQIYSIYLWHFLDNSNQIDSANNRPPDGFTNLFNKMVSLYGQPTTIENKVSSDPFVNKMNGITRRISWECNGTRLLMNVTYGSNKNATNIVNVEIINRNFQSVPAEIRTVQ